MALAQLSGDPKRIKKYQKREQINNACLRLIQARDADIDEDYFEAKMGVAALRCVIRDDLVLTHAMKNELVQELVYLRDRIKRGEPGEAFVFRFNAFEQ